MVSKVHGRGREVTVQEERTSGRGTASESSSNEVTAFGWKRRSSATSSTCSTQCSRLPEAASNHQTQFPSGEAQRN